MPSIRVTLTEAAGAPDAARDGAEGVGLACLESAILATGTHPRCLLEERGAAGYAELLSAHLLPMCQAFPEGPVWVRTLDFPTSALHGLRGSDEVAEPNPALGRRGIRRDLAWPEHHAAQWMAFRQVHEAGYERLSVLLPRVHDPGQLRAAQLMRDGAGLGEACGLGILVETPAAALCIETFIDAGVQCVSFCADHLAELTVGIDAAHPDLPVECDPAHPAVIRLIAGATAVCAQAGIETAVCSANGLPPDLLRRYLDLGVDSVSCEPDALQAVREAVARPPWTQQGFRGWDPSETGAD